MSKPQHKVYWDMEAIEREYCASHGCNQCEGINQDGEPNGYGCDGADEFAIKFSDLSLENMDEDDFNKIRNKYEAQEKELAAFREGLSKMEELISKGSAATGIFALGQYHGVFISDNVGNNFTGSTLLDLVMKMGESDV